MLFVADDWFLLFVAAADAPPRPKTIISQVSIGFIPIRQIYTRMFPRMRRGVLPVPNVAKQNNARNIQKCAVIVFHKLYKLNSLIFINCFPLFFSESVRESTSGSTPMRSIKNSNDGEGFDPDEDSTDEAKKSPQGYDQDEDSLDAVKKNAMPKLKGKTGRATEKPKLPKAPKAVKPKDPKEDRVGRIKSVSVVEPEMPEFDTLSTSKLQALEEIDPQKISRAASSFGGALQRIAKNVAQQQIKEMQLSCPTANINQEPSGHLRQGEVEFSGLGTGGHRAHYIIAPPEMENADEILRWMFVRQEGWRLKPPNLLLSCYGGRDHYVNWAQSPTLRNRDAWAVAPGSPAAENQPAKPFRRGGRVSAAVRARPKPIGARDSSIRPQMDDWQFRKKFTSRLSEISAGVCQAVTECGGWFDLGYGPRGGLNEVLMDGLKVYWSAFGCLAGHKTDAVVFCARLLQDTEFKDHFDKCAQPVPTAREKQGPLQERVMYPSVNDKLFPELGTDPKAVIADEQDLAGLDPDFEDTGKSAKSLTGLELEVRAQIARRFLCNALTHIVFVQNQQTLDRLRSKLRSLATRATIFANGNEALIQPGVDGKILMEAMAGVPVVCLHNTGGAAEMLGASVLKRRQPNHPDHANFKYAYDLPEHVPDDQFLILNPAKDSVEKVINKLTLVLSTVQDDEMMEVGFAKSEENRLRYAWEQHLLYSYNAAIFRQRARFLHYTAMALSVLVTIVAVLYSESRSDPGLSLPEAELKVSLLVLPCVSAFVLTSISRLNLVNKWAALESGSVHVKSEIYQYRCRVLDYQPRKANNMDIEDRVEELCDGPPTDDLAAVAEAAKKKRKKAEAAVPKGTSRRGTFSAALEQINSDATGSDVRGDYLRVPPVSAINELKDSLYDRDRVCAAYESRTSSFFSRFCRMLFPFGGRQGAFLDDDEGHPWSKAGSDFYQNPFSIDDDYLRDDGISLVTAEDYIHFRFLPMLQYYAWRSRELSRKVQALQVSIFFLTAVLAAASPLGYDAWIPIVVSIISFFTGILEFEALSSQLRNVNQSLESLKNLHFWWQSLSMVERRMPSNKNELVASTEATADSEISAWKKTLKVKNLKAGSPTGAEEAVEVDD